MNIKSSASVIQSERHRGRTAVEGRLLFLTNSVVVFFDFKGNERCPQSWKGLQCLWIFLPFCGVLVLDTLYFSKAGSVHRLLYLDVNQFLCFLFTMPDLYVSVLGTDFIISLFIYFGCDIAQNSVSLRFAYIFKYMKGSTCVFQVGQHFL